MEKTISVDDRHVIMKRYKVRRSGREGRTLETSIPREAFEREVRKLDVPLEEAVDELDAVWRYNSFAGLHLSFERKKP